MIDVDQLAPGPELDALVAEKVMGWKQSAVNGIYWVDQEGKVRARRRSLMFEKMWAPSSDIAAAWEVVEKLSDRFMFSLDQVHKNTKDGKPRPAQWAAGFLSLNPSDGAAYWSERSETAPLAICRAALKAVDTGSKKS
jgi:hypothetical protein